MDFAIDNNISCGGWCPKGRIAENGTIPLKYPLLETKTSKYPERTELNVRDSDGTLIIFNKNFDKGTILTIKISSKYNKPYFLYDFSKNLDTKEIKNWIKDNDIKILNIAGPRESKSRGIYELTYHLLCELFL